MIYLDSAATTLIKPITVAKSTAWAINNLASVGRGQYNAAAKAAEVVYKCREKTDKLFDVGQSDNVVMCFNATHALNLAINTLAYKGCRTVVSGYEHNAVMRPLRYLQADITVAASPLFDRTAAIQVFKEAVDNNTDLVVCTAMSNVFGFILPIYEISEICAEHDVPLIIDASQAAGAIELDFTKLNAAFMAMPGHKGLYGPQGTGLLLCSKAVKSLLYGGTGGDSKLPLMPTYLPDAGEAGTHNVAGIAGLNAGLDFVLRKTPKHIGEYERKLTECCIDELSGIKGVQLYHSDDLENQGAVLSFNILGKDPNETADILARKGICVRAGLHCAPLAHETANTTSDGTVRISFSAFTKLHDIYTLSGAVRSICNK